MLFCRLLRAGSAIHQQFKGLPLPPSDRMIMMRRDLLWHNRDGGSALQLIGLASPPRHRACRCPARSTPGPWHPIPGVHAPPL